MIFFAAMISLIVITMITYQISNINKLQSNEFGRITPLTAINILKYFVRCPQPVCNLSVLIEAER